MDAQPITTASAHITTVSVEVKAIRIGSKQMTQAVFRQLPVRGIWDEITGMISGIPWGLVNYFWPGCAKYPDAESDYSDRAHLHVVFEDQGVLYRDCVFDPARFGTVPYGVILQQERVEALALALQQGAVLVMARRAEHQPQRACAAVTKDGCPYTINWGTVTTKGSLGGWDSWNSSKDQVASEKSSIRSFLDHWRTHQVTDWWDDVEPPPGEGWKQHGYNGRQFHRQRLETPEEVAAHLAAAESGAREALQQMIQELAGKIRLDTVPDTEAEVIRLISPVANDWREARAEVPRLKALFAQQYAALKALDQLFIAV